MPFQENAPKISVIIPLYNAEKYLEECFESILSQTFQSFEVIVADDGSSDTSPKIVKKYIPRFGGRLEFLPAKTNTGSGAVPRNRGLAVSRGEYVFFMDSDDAALPDTFADLYSTAKKFDADVIYCRNYLSCKLDGKGMINSDEIKNAMPKYDELRQNEQTFLVADDMPKRIDDLKNFRYWWTPWIKFVRRDFLITNEIKFPPILITEDMLWTLQIILNAKRLVSKATTGYVYRRRDDSMTNRRTDPNKMIRKWFESFMVGAPLIDKILGEIPFFKENPVHRYDILLFVLRNALHPMRILCTVEHDISAPEFYEIIRTEFKKEIGEHDVLIPLLCSAVNLLNINFRTLESRIVETENLLKEYRRGNLKA